jgi:hypothetical protein
VRTFEGRLVRALAVGRNLFASLDVVENEQTRTAIIVVDLETGKDVTRIDVTFWVENVIAKDNHVWFAGTKGAIALAADGNVLWRIEDVKTKESSWHGDEYALVARRNGQEIWRFDVERKQLTRALLVLGEIGSQPDNDS